MQTELEKLKMEQQILGSDDYESSEQKKQTNQMEFKVG